MKYCEMKGSTRWQAWGERGIWLTVLGLDAVQAKNSGTETVAARKQELWVSGSGRQVETVPPMLASKGGIPWESHEFNLQGVQDR